jgi:hypothetical protein
MTTYLLVSNRDIICFKKSTLSKLNNNNFWVILFCRFLIGYILTSVFQSFFYFTTPFLFLLLLLFQFSFLISGYNTEEPKINFLKETIAFKIRKIEKIFLNQIKLFQYDLKKKHQHSFEYTNKFEKIWNNKPTLTLLRI